MLEYQNGELCWDGISLTTVASEWGTPAYLYNREVLVRDFLRIQRLFEPVAAEIRYALKANANPEIVSILAKHGAGADIVSLGELMVAVKAGIPPGKIVFAGVGKTDEEIRYAIKSQVSALAVESEQELQVVESFSQDMRQKQPVLIRVNPDVDPGTHPYISTGLGSHKFGIDYRKIEELARYCHAARSLRFAGLHMHIGSQIEKTAPVGKSLRILAGLVERIEKRGIAVQTLDLGGGFPVDYTRESARLLRLPAKKEPEENVAEYWAAAAADCFVPGKYRIIIEPGRAVSAHCGMLLAKILYKKKRGRKDMLIIDAGMNDFIRPALYGAVHGIVPLKEPETPFGSADVVGPVCETADFFARGARLPRCERGDYLAVLTAGAYGFVASSNYNLRCKPPELLIENGSVRCINKRENLKDLLKRIAAT